MDQAAAAAADALGQDRDDRQDGDQPSASASGLTEKNMELIEALKLAESMAMVPYTAPAGTEAGESEDKKSKPAEPLEMLHNFDSMIQQAKQDLIELDSHSFLLNFYHEETFVDFVKQQLAVCTGALRESTKPVQRAIAPLMDQPWTRGLPVDASIDVILNHATGTLLKAPVKGEQFVGIVSKLSEDRFCEPIFNIQNFHK